MEQIPGVDTVLGPEMKSTGEVMGVADNFGSVRQGATGRWTEVAHAGNRFISVTDNDKRHVADLARKFVDMGFKLVCYVGYGRRHRECRHECGAVYKVKEGRPNVVDFIKGQRIQLIVNTPTGWSRGSMKKPFGGRQ